MGNCSSQQHSSKQQLHNKKSINYNIPNFVEFLPDGYFGKFSHLRSIEIPRGVKQIGFRCFYGCSSLSTIIFQETLNLLVINAFSSALAFKLSKYHNQSNHIHMDVFKIVYLYHQLFFMMKLNHLGENVFIIAQIFYLFKFLNH
jgi:hypothetical protein